MISLPGHQAIRAAKFAQPTLGGHVRYLSESHSLLDDTALTCRVQGTRVGLVCQYFPSLAGRPYSLGLQARAGQGNLFSQKQRLPQARCRRLPRSTVLRDSCPIWVRPWVRCHVHRWHGSSAEADHTAAPAAGRCPTCAAESW